ncbi:MAG: cellulase family glycosylhydrolase [Gaiellaceae bacterium]
MASLRLSTTLLVSFALALALALPSSALGAAKGIESEVTWGVSSTVQSQDAAAMHDLGASWTRITLNWHDGEPSKGSYSTSYLGSVDRAVSLARQNGINVLMVVYGSPSWASGVSDPDAPPRNNQDYVNFLHAMVQRYAGQVPAWEVWNEENLGRFWGQQPNPGAYGNMLKLSYPAVKSADPNAKVVFGGMSGNDWDYLQSVYRDVPDINSYYDVMAVHPYSPIWSPDNVRYDGTGHIARDSFPGYREVRRVMIDHGADKPMYITEFGWATTSEPGLGVSAENQAAYTKLAFQCLTQDSYVQVAIIYELRNNWWAGDADDWEDQLGLANTNWSHKPAYDAFKSIDPSQGGCSYGLDPAAPTTPAPAPAGSPGSPGKTASTQTKTAGSTKHRVIVRVREVRTGAAHSARRARRHSLNVTGSVVGASGGRVQLRFERKAADGRWRKSLSLRVGVDRAGHFKRALATRSLGRWRVRAMYQDPQRPVQSRFAYFRV